MGRSYEDIKQECLRTGTLYVDPEFPADSRSLGQNHRRLPHIEWKRPQEIPGDTPVFIYGDHDYHDMDQGLLGNCWFVSSVACIAASPQKDLLKRVVPRDQGFDNSQYCGAFHFYFWQYGQWVEVVVDDRLPTLYGKLMYASNREHPNEYWCPLLEKAFAKLKGNYQVIDWGRAFDGMVDMTGGIGELLPLKDKISTAELETIILQAKKMNSCMGAAIYPLGNSSTRETRLRNGLYAGHAYTIVNVKKVQSPRYGEVTLLHVRNPWGVGEWKGAWSDMSREFKTLTTDNMEATTKTRNDGEFWISVEDFRRNFDDLELCHLTPDAFTDELARNLDRSEWKTTEYFGEWVKGKSAGGALRSFQSPEFWSNPQIHFNLSQQIKSMPVIVSLFEITNNFSNGINIGFYIFKYVGTGQPEAHINEHNYEMYPPAATSLPFWPYKERSRHYILEPAHYIIIPATYARGQETRFYLRIFSEETVTAVEDYAPHDGYGPASIQPTAWDMPAVGTGAIREFNETTEKEEDDAHSRGPRNSFLESNGTATNSGYTPRQWQSVLNTTFPWNR